MNSFTESQRQAIDARGNVLVVAGAGTGKTRTLVHRCVEWLLQERGANSLDQVLMVTFTEAAAAEMRQRIRSALKERLEEASRESAHLLEQLALLDNAFISTLHSFCLRLVRQHFYELELDPQLTVLPAEEAHLLANETLSDLLEKHYAGEGAVSEAVRRLIQVQARGWDAPVRRLILRLHHYTQTLPDPSGWFSHQQRLYEEPEPTCWREWLRRAVGEWKELWLPTLQRLDQSNPNVAACLAAVQGLPATPGLADAHLALEQILAAYRQPWPRGSVGKIRDRIKDFFQESEFLHSLTGRCVLAPELTGNPDLGFGSRQAPDSTAGEDPLAQDWTWVSSQMTALLALTVEFGCRFADAKRDQGVVDFHDLEQFSLRLLWDARSQRPTPLAERWQKRLRLIFVDEYQDINAAQDAILQALGGVGHEANRFLVGDPKQSIYRFRLADPHIFQDYTAQWRRDSSRGCVIALRENFRSRESILQFINSFFADVMTRELGGGPYDEMARLEFGGAGGPCGGPNLPDGSAVLPNSAGEIGSASPSLLGGTGPLASVEFHLRLAASKDSPDHAADDESDAGEGIASILTNAEQEARLIGLRLAELRARQRLIWDAELDGYRPVEWRDMVILLRSPQFKVESYAKEFSRLNIPLSLSRGGFFEAPEIMDLVSLLTVLDNPLQDIPLLAVMRSPFAALSFDQLAVIRLASAGRYWIALQQFHRLYPDIIAEPQAGAGLAEPVKRDSLGKLSGALRDPNLRDIAIAAWAKVDTFLRQFRSWRRLAGQTSLSEMLEQILRETNYEAFLVAHDRGQQQRGNISRFLTWSRQFEQSHRQGLYRFLKFLEGQKEAQIDREPAPLDARESVRLMSIHQSKGLEFGVVVLGDLGKSFNTSDLKADVILDEQYGLCPLVKPPFTQQRYPSLPYWMGQRRQRQEMLSEELRLLYVAMTRAQQCLILVGTASPGSIGRWAEQPWPASGRELLVATKYLDWIGPWMGSATGRPDWAECPEGASDLLQWAVYQEDDPRLASQTAGVAPDQQDRAGDLDPEILKAITRKLAWKYPHTFATEQPAKLSVSRLRAEIVADRSDEAQAGRRPASPVGRPICSEQLNAAAIGIAHHTFFQFLSLDALQHPEAFALEAERLKRERILSPAECAALDLKAIAGFWQSSTGREILSCREHIHRELPFTAKFALSELRAMQASQNATAEKDLVEAHPQIDPARLEQEFVIVTGAVDLVVLLPQEIWILDFKTDRVTPEDWRKKVRTYEVQLKLYALALSRIYQRPVTHCWLHSLALGRTHECS